MCGFPPTSHKAAIHPPETPRYLHVDGQTPQPVDENISHAIFCFRFYRLTDLEKVLLEHPPQLSTIVASINIVWNRSTIGVGREQSGCPL